MSGHRLVNDDRGWYCLNCDWPKADFTHRIADARAHKDETAKEARDE